jgi:hypothetical protein
MSLDIGSIMRSWPFKPGQVNVRRIIGDDGLEKIQLRLDLGILQMETTGRPDGAQPHGHTSLLSYYESQLQRHVKEHGSVEGFVLGRAECESLRGEGIMFYHRYLATFVLGDYDSAVLDTRRNLRMFDFCAAYAEEENDRHVLEQNRPYVMMMHVRAKAQAALQKKQPRRALAAVRKGLAEIEDIFRKLGREELIDTSREMSVLRTLAGEIRDQIPVNPKTRLRRALRKAIEEERYEEAAKLRDKLNELNEGRTAGSMGSGRADGLES